MHFLGFAGFNNDHYVHVTRGYQMLLGDAAPLDGAAVLERHRPAAAAMHCAP